MKFSNWNAIGLLVALAVYGAQGLALECENFAGNYITISDTAKPKVKVLQDACRSVTLVDNAGISWPIYLDGRTTQLPLNIAKQFGPSLTDASYSASLVGPNQIQIKAHTKISLVAPATNFKINTEVEYQGDAYLLDFQDGRRPLIQLETRSVKLLSVDAGNVVGGQSAGFLQGANWIMDMAKGMLDAKLQ